MGRNRDDILEIESMESLRGDSAWADLQEKKRTARIYYLFGYDCTCTHSQHNEAGCTACECTCPKH